MPRAALVVLAALAWAALIPEDRLAKAAATSGAVVAPIEVKVKPLTVTVCPAVKALKVKATVSWVATRRSPETHFVTPGASEGSNVSMPRPNSAAVTVGEAVVLSYQTDKLRPSGVDSFRPPLPDSMAVTPCKSVVALMLSITYARRSASVCPAGKFKVIFWPLTYKLVFMDVLRTVVLAPSMTAGLGTADTPVMALWLLMAVAMAMALAAFWLILAAELLGSLLFAMDGGIK